LHRYEEVDRLCELLMEEKSEAEKFGGELPMTVVGLCTLNQVDP
jgi:hypothetical protein